MNRYKDARLHLSLQFCLVNLDPGKDDRVALAPVFVDQIHVMGDVGKSVKLFPAILNL